MIIEKKKKLNTCHNVPNRFRTLLQISPVILNSIYKIAKKCQITPTLLTIQRIGTLFAIIFLFTLLYNCSQRCSFFQHLRYSTFSCKLLVCITLYFLFQLIRPWSLKNFFLFQLSRPPLGGKVDCDPGRAEERKLFVGMLR